MRSLICRLGSRIATLFAVLFVQAAISQPAVAAASSERTTVTGAFFVSELVSGHAFEARDMLVSGDVLLPPGSIVRAPVRCISCMIDGSFVGTGVSFENLVDLTGSTVTGTIDLRSASFARSLVWTAGIAERDVSFSGAEFYGTVTFSNTDFLGTSDFSRAVFGSAAVFSGELAPARHATDTPKTTCEQPSEGREGLQATTGTFGNVQFDWAVFRGKADFRGRCFARPVQISFVTIDGEADFSNTQFVDKVKFSDGDFGEGLSFMLARFRGDVDLERVTVGEDLLFDATDLGTGTVDLINANVRGGLRLANAQFSGHLLMDGVDVGSIVLDPRRVDWIVGVQTQIAVLQRIEDTSRRRGDAATASDARYEWLSRSGDRTDLSRPAWYPFIDHVLYRDVAGYLAYPSRPLLVFVILLLLGTVLRISGKIANAVRGGTAGAGSLGTKALHGVRFLPEALAQAFASTLSIAMRWKTPPTLDDTPTLPEVTVTGTRWVEYLSFKGLLVVAVLIIANSNQAFHQIVEAALNR